MAVKAKASITIFDVVDIDSTYRYYKLQSSSLSVPVVPTTFSKTEPPEGWTQTEPTYNSGNTDSLYFVDCTLFSDGSFEYTPVSLSSSYEAAKEAYNKSLAAESKADDISNELGDIGDLIGSDYENSTIYETLFRIIERTSTLEQTNSEFSFSFEEVRQALSDLGELSDEYNTKLSYVRITNDPAILLGSSESSFIVKITNDRISFMDDNIEIAYVSSERLEINDASVHNNLWFGNFRWFTRVNGNMALRWEEE